MSAPVLLDLSHTSHTRARTGIQRVARSLFHALGDHALPITHDPHRRMWRLLESWEHANLTLDGVAAKRGARWPLSVRIRSRLKRSLQRPAPLHPRLRSAAEHAGGLLVPEIFSPQVAGALPDLSSATAGPHVAVFHDAIALQFPELTPPKTVARFPSYLIELLAFDGIAAVSDHSHAALVEYWNWLGARHQPRVTTIGLGMEIYQSPPPTADAPFPPGEPVVLCVGSIEGRKNHPALLDACEQLWSGGARFTLRLVGLAQPQTAAAALARISALQAFGRPLRYDGPVDEATLHAAYRACTFTVYPSLVEGYGLPVLESVAHGRPCICSARGALGEAARGGGCVALDQVDAPSLASAIRQLLDAPAHVETLRREARARPCRSWSEYAAELRRWMHELPVRARA